MTNIEICEKFIEFEGCCSRMKNQPCISEPDNCPLPKTIGGCNPKAILRKAKKYLEDNKKPTKSESTMITTKEQLIEKLNGNFIHCETVGCADAVLVKLNKFGYIWKGGASLLSSNNYSHHHNHVVYYVNDLITFSRIEHAEDKAKEKGKEIIKSIEFFSWFATDEEKAKPKSEDVMSITKEELIKKMVGSVIHCGTVKLSDEVLKQFNTYLGESKLVPYFYGTGTCYTIHAGKVVFGELSSYNRDGKIIVEAEEFLSWFDVEKKELAAPAPAKKPLNKREQILKNQADISKWCDKATKCYDGKNVIAYYNNSQGYIFEKTLTPEQALKVANWIINLEKVVK